MTSANPIPFLDLVSPHAQLQEELISVFRSALETAGFIGGPMLQAFEEDFAKFCETDYCVGVGSGTDALRFALIAAGIKPGDIVITVPNTFIATTEAITQAGGCPAFVDIDEATYNLDPDKLRKYVESECRFNAQSGQLFERSTDRRVAAIVPVHLYGQMADMDSIHDIATRYKLTVIEDACQAHGAEYFSRRENRWRKAGSMGKAAAFSFYPGKNLGACGEAGAVTTDDLDIGRKVQMLRDHGQTRKYHHDIEGYNGRLDSIQAGILQVKLKHLPAWNEMRRAAAARYNALFVEAKDLINPPHVPAWSRPVHHLYVIRVKSREQMQESLAGAGIGTSVHYPVPLHLTSAYASLGFRPGAFPIAERAAAEVLSLPMFPGLDAESQHRVAQETLGVLRTVGVAAD